MVITTYIIQNIICLVNKIKGSFFLSPALSAVGQERLLNIIARPQKNQPRCPAR